MARRQGKRTLLIDHHARLGHAGVYLGVESGGYTFEEVMRNLPRLDSELLRRFVAKHPSGLELLTSPDAGHGFQNTEDDDLKDDAELIHRTLEFLRGEYDYIVVDCDRTSFERNHPVFTASNWVYLVGTPEVAAIRDMARYIDELALMEDAVEKVRILINRWNTSYALPLDQIEQAIKQPIAVKVPTGYPEMVRAANLGEPISSQSAGEISDTFDRWINEIAGEGDPVKPTRERRRLTLWRNEAPAH